MPRDLFDTVAHAPTPVGSRSGVTLSLLVHAATLAVIVVIPLVATDVLPVPDRAISLIVVRPDLPGEPPRPDAPTPRREPATAQHPGRARTAVRDLAGAGDATSRRPRRDPTRRSRGFRRERNGWHGRRRPGDGPGATADSTSRVSPGP
jgi:hypothetical protein